MAGGGLAGLRTVEELRARGYAGEVTLVGAETRPPYDRPPLSKRLMAGELADTTLRDDLAALGVGLRLGETATGLESGLLRTDRGEHRFDRLVLATGASRWPCRAPARSGSCARSMTRWRCGRGCAPGCGWRSSAPAGSAPSWPRRRRRAAAG